MPAPAGFGLKPYCRVHRAILADLQHLLDAAKADPAVGGELRGLSCHREVARQRNVFCRDRSVSAAERAISVAPAGYSEHATAMRSTSRWARSGLPGCGGVHGRLPGGALADRECRRFGFEMSFPAGNRQRVKWEPWHWRWVGTSPGEPGAAQAQPGVRQGAGPVSRRSGIRDPLRVVVSSQPPLPVVAAPPAPIKKKGKRR